MSRMLSPLQAVLLGLVALGGIALVGAGLFAIGSRQGLFGDALPLRVGFPQAQGVEPGTRVRVQGVDAGEVARVAPPAQPGEPVILHLRLEGRYRALLRADSTAQIVSEGLVGGKVVNLDPGTAQAAAIQDDALIGARNSIELADLMTQVDRTLQDVRQSQGTLGKLIHDDRAYQEAVEVLKQGKGTLAAIQQDAEAIKRLPIIRSYVQDMKQLLVRPECERHRQWFSEAELFEPGRAVLTESGRRELDKLGPWLEGLKHTGSDIVVASWADAKLDPQLASTISQKQSETVCDYLTTRHAAHKLGWVSRRKITPLGCGQATPPGDERPLPSPRVEVMVFVPQK